jgi:DNA-binding MarR family transcriptional regulator
LKRISTIGSLLKRIYRLYSQELLQRLNDCGFSDLRPSFLEILSFICENDGPTIKSIGKACGLKKQTMTSHLNDLEKRGYVVRKTGQKDKREQCIFLTEYGEKFRFSLLDSIAILEKEYIKRVGDVEIERVQLMLENFHGHIKSESGPQVSFFS